MSYRTFIKGQIARKMETFKSLDPQKRKFLVSLITGHAWRTLDKADDIIQPTFNLQANKLVAIVIEPSKFDESIEIYLHMMQAGMRWKSCFSQFGDSVEVDV